MTEITQGKMRRAAMVWVGVREGTPLGRLWVACTDEGLVAVDLLSSEVEFTHLLRKLGFGEIAHSEEKTRAFLDQICEYLNGSRRDFDFPIDWSIMTGFKEVALKSTVAIPYGETRTYLAIAEQLGRPRAARAVGRAEATNPMPIVIPCHRVLGSDGRLHGYGAGEGLATKSWLLALESGPAGASQ
jgi:methylated-DNA-[protein]-cysteine S-methyltransferase